MLKLAQAAYAVALVSVMAISAGPANAQQSVDMFHELACIDSAGLCYTQSASTEILDLDTGGTRFVNMYRAPDGNTLVAPYGAPLARGMFGVALEEQLAIRGGRYLDR